MRGYFPAVLGRFSDAWRPDALNNSTRTAERYLMDFPRCALASALQVLFSYCMFVIFSRFTQPGAARLDLYAITADKLWDMINYCNLMLESVLSESSLSHLTTEILATRGPLPVGEIGKILADSTSISSLSQRLKEKFNGLKKFLEHFPTSFVIFNDHPFNPNVLLRAAIGSEHLELIDKGIFPHQLLAKAKKVSGGIVFRHFIASV